MITTADPAPITLAQWAHVTMTASDLVSRFDLLRPESGQIKLARGQDASDGGIWELSVDGVVIARSKRFGWYNEMVFWQRKMASLRTMINRERRLAGYKGPARRIKRN